MAAADYLRAAAAEVRKAAQDLNSQVRDAQTSYDHNRRHLESEISSQEIEVRTKDASVATMDDPNEIKGMRIQIATLQKLANDRKQELSAQQSKVQSEVSSKLAFANQLESLASQIEGMVGRPEAG